MMNVIVLVKEWRRMKQGVCVNCGSSPCACAIPKRSRRMGWFSRCPVDLPVGIRRFKKRPKR